MRASAHTRSDASSPHMPTYSRSLMFTSGAHVTDKSSRGKNTTPSLHRQVPHIKRESAWVGVQCARTDCLLPLVALEVLKLQPMQLHGPSFLRCWHDCPCDQVSVTEQTTTTRAHTELHADSDSEKIKLEVCLTGEVSTLCRPLVVCNESRETAWITS